MKTTRIVRAALIAGIYVVLCLVLQPFSYGPIQVRVSEALTLLPVFTPDAIWAVTLGCFLSNMFSMSPWDMLFGTLATFLAAICTYQLRRIRFKGLPVLSCLPPILFNAVIVGAEITYIFMPETASVPVLLFNMVTVGLGEVVSCGILGLLLVKTIERTPQLCGWIEATK
ncbi:QueT transporter family protein [uncultured Ruthenibacterium sp.]|uniref:QueT transporter family protein n=1 Tax=uncultured Ruthenibacterium sp. TaxID=1905347 RepID=UPI00349EC3B1